MKAVIRRLVHRFDREVIERQIEEELRLHLELLTEHHLQRDMSLAEARDATVKRFGNVAQIKDQCVQIRRGNGALTRVLKSFLILIFLLGILVRVTSTELGVHHLGDILILVAVSGRLFFYVRSLRPSHFPSKHDPSLMLKSHGLTSFTAYDQKGRTPVERVISDS
jgi:hypothetical protein